MEHQFFTWTGWDQQGTMDFTYYECTLIQDIGRFTIGTVINTVYISYETGVMIFYNEDGTEEIAKFQLGLVIL